VDWQLDGKSEQETDQKCHALGEGLGMRLKPLLEKIRSQIETTERRYKSLGGQIASQKALEQVKTEKIAGLEQLVQPEAPPAALTNPPGKRKGVEVEVEAGGKRLHHE
jgi:hypothetical protein